MKIGHIYTQVRFDSLEEIYEFISTERGIVYYNDGFDSILFPVTIDEEDNQLIIQTDDWGEVCKENLDLCFGLIKN